MYVIFLKTIEVNGIAIIQLSQIQTNGVVIVCTFRNIKFRVEYNLSIDGWAEVNELIRSHYPKNGLTDIMT